MAGLGPVLPTALQGLVSPGAAPALSAPSLDDVARFNSAMGDNPAAPGATASLPDAGQASAAPSGPDGAGAAVPVPMDPIPAPAAATPAAATPGDAILQGLQKMNGDFHASIEGLSGLASLKPGEMMSSSELLKAQFALTQVTMQQDMTSKVVGKVTQDLDTFLKNG